jgi:hypothetical protein
MRSRSSLGQSRAHQLNSFNIFWSPPHSPSGTTLQRPPDLMWRSQLLSLSQQQIYVARQGAPSALVPTHASIGAPSSAVPLMVAVAPADMLSTSCEGVSRSNQERGAAQSSGVSRPDARRVFRIVRRSRHIGAHDGASHHHARAKKARREATRGAHRQWSSLTHMKDRQSRPGYRKRPFGPTFSAAWR